MSDLWIYYRRPSSLVRYRHGGAAAFDPAVRSPLAKAVVQAAGADSADADKILQFPLPLQAQRPARSTKRRRGRVKPTKPKKRDS